MQVHELTAIGVGQTNAYNGNYLNKVNKNFELGKLLKVLCAKLLHRFSLFFNSLIYQ